MRNKETILEQSDRVEADDRNSRPRAERVQTTLLIETLCDIRDLLQKLVDKGKSAHELIEEFSRCPECLGTKWTTEHEEVEEHGRTLLKPVKVPCPSCCSPLLDGLGVIES